MEVILHAISPREIQARVRAGAAPEVVAAENDWPLDKVMRYAEPVLGERAYVCELAQGVELHRSRGVTVLSDAVFSQSGVTGTWDSWRESDGSWHVTVEVAPRETAEWIFEPVGRTVHPVNPLARTLMELGDTNAPVRTASATSRTEGTPSSPASTRSTAVVDEMVVESDTESVTHEVSIDRRNHLSVVTEVEEQRETVVIQEEFTDMPAAKGRKSKKGRAHVPSWDEILFGTKSQE